MDKNYLIQQLKELSDGYGLGISEQAIEKAMTVEDEINALTETETFDID